MRWGFGEKVDGKEGATGEAASPSVLFRVCECVWWWLPSGMPACLSVCLPASLCLSLCTRSEQVNSFFFFFL